MQYIYEGEYNPALPDDELSGPTQPEVTASSTPRPSQKRGQTKFELMELFTPQSVPHQCVVYGVACREPNVCRHHTCGHNCNNSCQGFTCEECYVAPTAPTAPTALPITGPSTQLMVHAKLYEIADKYDVVGLKELVIEKFKRACHSFWNDPSFAAAAHHVFSTTPEHDKGLRDIVSKTIAEHMAELVKKPEVEALLTEFNGLAFGLLKMKTEAGWK